LGIIPPLIKPGFPPNHEDDAFVLRTMVYAKHFQFGDLIPVWASSDNYGMGSPLPGLYHRLFYLVSGLVYVISDNTKISIASALIAFTSIGVYFVFLTLRSFNCSKQLAMLGASTLPFLNYSVTNWLVRGAMAEYSAMMLIPLVMYIVKKSWDRKLLYAKLGFVFGFLFLAHSVIAYFVAIILGFVLIAACVFRILPLKFFAPTKIAQSVITFGAVTWWSLLPMLYFRQRFDMRRLLPDFLNVQLQFHAATEYFWDSAWAWSNPPQFFTVRMDIVLVAGCAVLLLMRRYSKEHSLLFFVLGISLFLQNGRGWRIYNIIPGAEFIQFPWRLSTVSSVVLLVLVFVGLKNLGTVAIIVAVLTILLSGTWQRVNYYNYPDRLEVRNSRTLSAYSLSLFGEYLPADAALLEPDPSSSAVFSEWKNQIDTFLNTFNNSKNCQVNRVSPIAEIKLIEFTTRCVQDSVVLLPIFATDAHATKSNHSGFQKNCIVEKRYQSLCAVSVPSGFTSVDVQIPSITQVLSKTLMP
jgi:hypothetical protein